MFSEEVTADQDGHSPGNFAHRFEQGKRAD
jgi:hypothetical protein